MAAAASPSSSILLSLSSRSRLSDSSHSFSIIPTSLALITSLSILFYIYHTSNLYPSPLLLSTSLDSLTFIPPATSNLRSSPQIPSRTDFSSGQKSSAPKTAPASAGDHSGDESRLLKATGVAVDSDGNNVSSGVFHDKDLFLKDYEEMNRSLKIYVYPHSKDEPFAHALLPVDFEPGGNYASESYFKKVLMQSHFITKDPSEADLFFLPFSIARLRHDPRVDVGGIQDFVRSYITNVIQNYPYWNRSGGADHFYVACHSTGRSAMEKATEAKFNAIQVVCSSSHFLSGYVAHKDASLPQIWPRQGDPPELSLSNRKKLAFFAGSANSPVREKLFQAWKNDPEIFVHSGRLETPYSDGLLHSKFCLHVKGFELNTFHCDFWHSCSHLSSSYIWKSISSAREHIKHHYHWRVGDRRTIRFFQDNWAPMDLHIELSTFATRLTVHQGCMCNLEAQALSYLRKFSSSDGNYFLMHFSQR